MRVLFLDIDGVLNTHTPLDANVMCGRILVEKVRVLNTILERTDAKIVLSSAWRYLVHNGDMVLSGMDWLLRSHGVYANRLIGVTRPDTMIGNMPKADERGEQISEWLKSNPEYTTYAVLDDMDLGISEAGLPFVLVDGDVGLVEKDATLAVDMLSE